MNKHQTNNHTKFKKKYFSPIMSCIIFEIENCIASTSTQLQIGGNSGTPEVTDWVEKKDEQFWDF